MSAWSSSSLVASDHNKMRHKSGLMKNLPTRLGKTDIVGAKMFGSKRKGIQLGKSFKKSGKGIMKHATSGDKMPKEGGISPSLEDFDKMMKNVVKGSSSKGMKKSMFSRKQFG